MSIKNSTRKTGNLHYARGTAGQTKFELDNDTFVVVNSLSGDIVHYQKPITKSWEKIFRKIDNLVKKLNNNFNDKDIVQKKTIELAPQEV